MRNRESLKWCEREMRDAAELAGVEVHRFVTGGASSRPRKGDGAPEDEEERRGRRDLETMRGSRRLRVTGDGTGGSVWTHSGRPTSWSAVLEAAVASCKLASPRSCHVLFTGNQTLARELRRDCAAMNARALRSGEPFRVWFKWEVF